ncbi:MAG: proprotein convertase P-domain-containing protein [Saprospiraceae bacterium]|nr:proprotein convertase P-domain-containing protein [Saprospiraceae bacterium]
MRFWFLLGCFLCSNILWCQTSANFFKPVPEHSIALSDGQLRKVFPQQYHTFRLDYPAIQATLQQAPMEFTAAARHSACVLEIPQADGRLESFSVWETQLMEPELAKETPFVRTFSGRSLNNPGKTVALSYTLHGFHAMILRPDFGVEYVERYAWGQQEYYLAYDAKDLPKDAQAAGSTGWQLDPAQLHDDPRAPFVPQVESRGTLLEPVELKQFKLVVSTTGEWGQDNGTTKQEVFSAVMEKIQQLNAIYERDLHMRLNVIQGSQLLCYFDPSADPFIGTTVGEWMSQNKAALDALGVPESAYDLGHVFARGGGGVAGGITCTASKARGCTAGTAPYGHNFIYVLGQEIGHQMSAGHTWNRCNGGAPDQRKGGTAYEPGSGSTIMSYCGACGGDDIQNTADLYFHSGSIQEIQFFLDYGPGLQCGTSTPTGNTAPEVTLPYTDNFFIPIGTPFELDGSATDADGDPLSYCWEQMDIGPETPLSTPLGNSPLFRTRPAVDVTNRYFPRLTTVINNGFDVTEQLPAWTRDMTFRLTARDNRPGGGGVGYATVAFQAWAGAGPFLVSTPNNPTDVWNIGEYVEVAWDVANTDKAPVNCKYVNIRLSTDGGLTYPVTLATNVGNDGNHYVLVPNLPTNTARVRIDGAGSVFYDISNKNFRIAAPSQPSFTMGLVNDVAELCLPASHTVQLVTAGVLGFDSPVALSIEASTLPANVTATWSATTIQPGESATLNLDFSKVDVEAVFTLTVKAEVAGGGTFLRNVVMTTYRNDFSALALNLPPNGATELGLQQILHWTKALDALSYDLEFGTDPSFAAGTVLATLNTTTIDSFKIPVFLSKGTAYFWRVRPRNECGIHDWTEPYFFSTYVENCQQRDANDLPLTISASSAPTIESKISVTNGGPIKNMEVKQLMGYHEFFKNLEARLISPQGTEVVLWTGKCANYNGSFHFRLSDEAPGAFPCPPPKNGQAYRPQNPLAAFYGEQSTGVWTLRLRDDEIGAGGALQGFRLEFCTEAVVSPPYLVNNNILSVEPGKNRAITPDLLLVEDANNSHGELQYTLVATPKHGHLERAWTGAMQPGAHFTQTDIDNGALRFFDYGTDATPDYFTFIVTDGEGGFLGTPQFTIQPLPVGTYDLESGNSAFRLYPNPTDDAVWVDLGLPARSDLRVSVFNVAGQLLQENQLAAGNERLLLHTAGLPRGLYFVAMQGQLRKLVLR